MHRIAALTLCIFLSLTAARAQDDIPTMSGQGVQETNAARETTLARVLNFPEEFPDGGIITRVFIGDVSRMQWSNGEDFYLLSVNDLATGTFTHGQNIPGVTFLIRNDGLGRAMIARKKEFVNRPVRLYFAMGRMSAADGTKGFGADVRRVERIDGEGRAVATLP